MADAGWFENKRYFINPRPPLSSLRRRFQRVPGFYHIQVSPLPSSGNRGRLLLRYRRKAFPPWRPYRKPSQIHPLMDHATMDHGSMTMTMAASSITGSAAAATATASMGGMDGMDHGGGGMGGMGGCQISVSVDDDGGGPTRLHGSPRTLGSVCRMFFRRGRYPSKVLTTMPRAFRRCSGTGTPSTRASSRRRGT